MFLSCHHPRGVGPKSCGAGVPRWLWLVLCRIQRLPQASRPGDAFSGERPGLLQAGSLTPCSRACLPPSMQSLTSKGPMDRACGRLTFMLPEPGQGSVYNSFVGGVLSP